MSVIPNSEYRFLGPTGLRVSSISLGGWVTYGQGQQVADETALKIFKKAFELGINFFDTAEIYGAGECEISFGKLFKELGWKRETFVLSTKLFWGGKTVNEKGLSRKHLLEGMNNSLKRLQVDYVDVVFAHRPDRLTPMEEIVRGFTQIINDGKAFYWGTSMWTAYEIEHAHHVATKFGLIPPVVEQPVYNFIERTQFEKELAPIFEQYNYGSTVFSPLATGLFSGKYSQGIPQDSRYSASSSARSSIPSDAQHRLFETAEGKANLEKITKMQKIADELGYPLAPFTLAVMLKNKYVSTLIIGASKPEQVEQNLQAYEILPKVTDEIVERVEKIFNNKVGPVEHYNRL